MRTPISKWAQIAAGALCATLMAGSASAGVIFHATNPAFQAAMAGNVNQGTEDFEGSTLAPAMLSATFTDPLAAGVPNGALFPAGLLPGPGITVQANTLGGVAVNPSPRGAGALITASVGFAGTPSDQVSQNTNSDSFDILVNPPVAEPVLGVGLAPLFFDTQFFNINATGNIRVEVYNTLNALIGTTTVMNVDYGANTPLEFIGIEATGTDDIGRINLFDQNINFNVEGADNIEVFTAQPATPMPEPGTLAILGLGLAGLGLARRRKAA